MFCTGKCVNWSSKTIVKKHPVFVIATSRYRYRINALYYRTIASSRYIASSCHRHCIFAPSSSHHRHRIINANLDSMMMYLWVTCPLSGFHTYKRKKYVSYCRVILFPYPCGSFSIKGKNKCCWCKVLRYKKKSYHIKQILLEEFLKISPPIYSIKSLCRDYDNFKGMPCVFETS